MTQYSINIEGTNKYPDLIGFIRRKQAILFEVKIGAGFTYRKTQHHAGKVVYVPQLVDYGKWLNQHNSNGVLVLLSHSTLPPDDYLKCNNKYGIKTKNYITWNRVHHWLINPLNNYQKNCLTKDFSNFLTEQNMATESPVRNDFALLDLFVSGAGKRIESMMRYTREELEKKYKSHFSWGKEKSYLNSGLYTVDYDQRLVWSWVIMDSQEYAFLAWGVCFPDESDEWEWRKSIPSIPEEPFVFMGVFSDKREVANKINNLVDVRPENWKWASDREEDKNDLIGISCCSLNEFLAFKKDTSTEFFNFIDSAFQESTEIVEAICK